MTATFDSDKPAVPVQRPKLDWILFITTLALLSIGVVMVFNASYPLAIEVYKDKAFFVKKQALWATIGLFGMFWASRLPFWRLMRWANAILLVALFLLVAVLAVGHAAQGGQRWIGYGPVKVQPSEFVKLALILFLAHILATKPWLTKRLVTGVLPIMGVVGGICFLVERQPDLGTAITILLTALAMLCVSGVRARWILAFLAFSLCCATVFALHKGVDGYRWKRMITFMNPDSDALGAGYQIKHSKIALGTGGWGGVGMGESREKRLGNLPAQRTDFIFAIIGEEFGLTGTGTVLMLFLVFTARGIHIAHRTKSPFGALLAVGITSMVTVQALINIGVVTASLPATGIPLPLISYGGSALVPTLFGIGILLNISQNPSFCEPKPRPRRRRRGTTTTTTGATETPALAAVPIRGEIAAADRSIAEENMALTSTSMAGTAGADSDSSDRKSKFVASGAARETAPAARRTAKPKENSIVPTADKPKTSPRGRKGDNP